MARWSPPSSLASRCDVAGVFGTTECCAMLNYKWFPHGSCRSRRRRMRAQSRALSLNVVSISPNASLVDPLPPCGIVPPGHVVLRDNLMWPRTASSSSTAPARATEAKSS